MWGIPLPPPKTEGNITPIQKEWLETFRTLVKSTSYDVHSPHVLQELIARTDKVINYVKEQI